nr:FtsX-like permease family protein [Candidatus Sigynarchaeota archaeon]
NGFGGWVPRYANYYWNLAIANSSGMIKGNMYSYLAGIDVNLPEERDYGKAILLSVHPNFTALTDQVGNSVYIEDLLKTTTTLQRPIVVTKLFLESNDLLGNVSAGDKIYIQNQDYLPGFPNSAWGEPTTWPYYTITAIIDDKGEMATYSLYNNFLYLNMEDMWNYIYNGPWGGQGDITYMFVHCTDETRLDEVQEEFKDLLEDTTTDYIYTYAPKKMFMTTVDSAMVYVRIFFSVIAGISLVVCGVLIKNLFETAKQTDIHEIGILKGIGFDQGFITRIYVSQILIMSSIGILAGLGIGVVFSYAFVLVLKNSALSSLLLGRSFEVLIAVSISPLTLGIGVLAGYAVPLLFGIIPVLQTARTKVIDAIQSRTGSRVISTGKKVWQSLIVLGIGVMVAVLSAYAVKTSINQIILTSYIDFSKLTVPLILIFLGTIGFLMGLIFIGIFCLPALSKAFTWLFLLPVQRSLKNMCHRNLMRNKRRTINTFMMMAIGLSFMVTITTLTNSISAGAYPGRKARLGGDIALGYYWNNYYANNMTVDRNLLGMIGGLPSISATCLYRYSIDLSRLPISGTVNCFGNKVDDYGFITRNKYSINEYSEYLDVGIIDAVEYYNINKDAFLKMNETDGNIGMETLFQRLNDENVIILQDDIKPFIDKNPGDTIMLQFEGMSASLVIAGYADILPGFPWTLNIASMLGGYYSSPNTHDYCGVISWNTYDRLLDGFYKDIDLIVKNKFWDYGSYYSDYWGLLGFPINASTVQQVLSPYLANSTIKNMSLGITNFYPLPIEYRNSKPFEYHRTNQTQMSDLFFQQAWNPMNASLISVDFNGDHEYGGPRIVDVNPLVPVTANSSVEKILDWFDKNTNVNACVVNQQYAHKPNNPLGSGDMDLDSVYGFDMGDVVRVAINATTSYNFTIVATVDSNLNYDYTTTDNVTKPLVLNPKSLNFDAYYQDGTPGSGGPGNLLGTYYAESNVVMVSRNLYLEFFTKFLDMLEDFVNWEIFPGVRLGNMAIFNKTLEYKNDVNDYSTILYIDVDDNASIDLMQQQLQASFLSIPETHNFTVFNPRKMFFQITGFDKGNAFLGAPRDKLEAAVEEIKALYMLLDRPFDESQVDYFGKNSWDTYLQDILGIFTAVFNMILAFALAISLIGLSISMLISVHQRRREIGTLRSVGYSRRQVLALIYGESMTLGLLGIIIGLFSGLFTAYMMISQIPFIIVLPILFTPPVETYVYTCIQLFTIFLAAAIVPAYTSMKLDIAEVLRSPE